MSKRTVVVAASTAVVSTGLAILINLATDWKTNPWVWFGVVVLTIAAFLISLSADRRSAQGDDRRPDGSLNQEISGSSFGVQAGRDANVEYNERGGERDE